MKTLPMRIRTRLFFEVPRGFLGSWILLLLAPAGAQTPGQDWIEHDRLEAGEILVDFGEDTRFKGLIKTAVLIDALPETIWEILTDCESAPEYVPHVRSCELIDTADQGRTQVFLQEIKYAWFLPAFEHVFSLRYQPYARMEVQRISGPLEHLEGVWRLLPAGDRSTMLLYDLELRVGLLMPHFAVGAYLTRDIPIVLGGIRERAESAN